MQFILEYWAQWAFALMGGAVLAAIPKIKALWQAVLAMALINQILSAAGKPVLPIESAQLEQLISTGFTTVSALVNWWFNNSFTKEAIQADAEFERLRKSVK